MDRNAQHPQERRLHCRSLSARRAWIEIGTLDKLTGGLVVALRKESVDRNNIYIAAFVEVPRSLSARRAWIEI